MAPKVTAVIDRPIVSARKGEKAAAIRRTKLRYPELSEGQIARRVGCDPANVHRVLKRFLGDHSEQELREFQESKADIYDALQMRQLKSITDTDIAKAQLLPRVTASAILEDKARTIRGQATQVNVTVLLDAVQAIKEMRARQSNPPMISA
jgi:hypothetical protein